MLSQLIAKVIGTRNARLLKQFQPKVKQIGDLEDVCRQYTGTQLRAQYAALKARHGSGTSLDALLAECFALVREAGRRTLQQRHYDVQLMGGMVLHQGKIAEMSTGEGKTQAATLPAALNALSGKPVHIVTFNDYLAKRDAEWMRPLYECLGLSVGFVAPDQPREEKRAAYACDIVYATNSELGFDYLRDQMAYELSDRVQRGLHYAIVDEVDSILIDEARTPLIISGAAEDSSDLYRAMNQIIPLLSGEEKQGRTPDYTVDMAQRQVYLTDSGHERVEGLLTQNGLLKAEHSLYDPINGTIIHHLYAALRAHVLFKRDVDYMVNNQQIMIVDEHTGRTMAGRRWSDGLHQAIEAKEGVPIQQENQTLASITLQNFFRMYRKLSGMTGTAVTEEFEFQEIYGLEVAVIPTNKPCLRADHGDVIYLTESEKYEAILTDIQERHKKGQPILVGTISIENSERLSDMLQKAKIPHQILNAKYHAQEAQIVAEAGRLHAVTIATNMAGRGTDIVLGGCLKTELAGKTERAEIASIEADWRKRHDAVIALGGLHILGTERHESRRIDNQLRGRAARQGDPGSSQFFLCFDDGLMRMFASERVMGLMRRLGVKEGEAITHPWVTRSIENAQKKVEGIRFEQRKQILQYDNVAGDQRRVVYALREQWLTTTDMNEVFQDMADVSLDAILTTHIPHQSMPETWTIAALEGALRQYFVLSLPISTWLEQNPAMDEDS
ncbi:MAG: preprotein translocase subunit SecA, partial [Pseudomonadota bacterium]